MEMQDNTESCDTMRVHTNIQYEYTMKNIKCASKIINVDHQFTYVQTQVKTVMTNGKCCYDLR